MNVKPVRVKSKEQYQFQELSDWIYSNNQLSEHRKRVILDQPDSSKTLIN